MDDDDPQKRIAELERQLAEQKRIAELERQLADAKAAAGGDHGAIAQLREATSGAAAKAGMSQAQLDDELRNAMVTVRTGHSVGYLGPNGQRGDRRQRKLTGGTLVGAIGGLIGICVGGAAALTAMLPSSALWTSAIVCGGPNQLMVNTSHYSYKPGQSGTSVDFQCLGGDGGHAVNFLAISALQTLFVALAVVGVLAIGVVVRSVLRKQSMGLPKAIIAGVVGAVALGIVVAVLWQAIASASGPTQMAHGGSLTVKGNGETKTIACNDGYLTVDGRDETVTVTGHCARVSVDGVIHHVTVDSTDAIDVDGVNNVVTYHSGSPHVTKSGAQNTVQQG
jgi:uncharacterized membrane protein YeaQ/YmgE (transglycosylase-associated protein family)